MARTAVILLPAGQRPALPAIMKTRPIYRMKSFWLGIFVICFLGWAWWDSLGHTTLTTWQGSQRGVQGLRMEGSSFLIVGPSSQMVFYPIGKSWGYARTDLEPEMIRTIIEHTRVNSKVWELRDEVGFVCFVAGWCAFLFWRRRREARRENVPGDR